MSIFVHVAYQLFGEILGKSIATEFRRFAAGGFLITCRRLSQDDWSNQKIQHVAESQDARLVFIHFKHEAFGKVLNQSVACFFRRRNASGFPVACQG